MQNVIPLQSLPYMACIQTFQSFLLNPVEGVEDLLMLCEHGKLIKTCAGHEPGLKK